MSDLINGVPVESLHSTGFLPDGLKKIINPRSGREVIDTEQHENWRQAYRDYISSKRTDEENNIREAISRRDLGPLNIYGSKEVSEIIGCCQATAYLYLKSGIIPGFQLGKRWFTHDYILETIEIKAKSLEESGYTRRQHARMVWKSDQGKSW